MSALFQKFKLNDVREDWVNEVLQPSTAIVGSSFDDFFQNSFTAYPLGDAIYDANADPLVGVVTKEVYRQSFPAIHQIFTRPGTFDFYIDLFRAVFGQSVEIVFDTPNPGHLVININALTAQRNIFIARRIQSNVYFYDRVTDHDGDYIAFQFPQGIKTQDDLDALMREIKPAGIYVNAILDIT